MNDFDRAAIASLVEEGRRKRARAIRKSAAGVDWPMAVLAVAGIVAAMVVVGVYAL